MAGCSPMQSTHNLYNGLDLFIPNWPLLQSCGRTGAPGVFVSSRGWPWEQLQHCAAHLNLLRVLSSPVKPGSHALEETISSCLKSFLWLFQVQLWQWRVQQYPYWSPAPPTYSNSLESLLELLLPSMALSSCAWARGNSKNGNNGIVALGCGCAAFLNQGCVMSLIWAAQAASTCLIFNGQ